MTPVTIHTLSAQLRKIYTPFTHTYLVRIEQWLVDAPSYAYPQVEILFIVDCKDGKTPIFITN